MDRGTWWGTVHGVAELDTTDTFIGVYLYAAAKSLQSLLCYALQFSANC